MECTVLLIEPSDEIRRVVCDALQPPHFNVITVFSGDQACKSALSQAIHLIILGTAMINWEGIMERLREVPGMRVTPLILLLFSPIQRIDWDRIGRSDSFCLSYKIITSKELLPIVNRLLGLSG